LHNCEKKTFKEYCDCKQKYRDTHIITGHNRRMSSRVAVAHNGFLQLYQTPSPLGMTL